MNKVYLEYNKKSFNKIYYYSILPLILYGLYKNGIILYLRKHISLINIFRPVLFLVSAFLIILLFNLIKNRKVQLVLDDYKWLFITLFIPLNTNYLLFLVLFIIFIIIDKLTQNNYINLSILFKLLLIIGLYFLNNYSYQNIMEASSSFNYNLWDLIMGKEVGGIASTSYFYILITYIILITNIYYKKNIALIASISFTLLLLILSIFFPSLVSTSNLGGIFLAFVILATDFKYSPYILKAQIIYSFLLAILTVVFSILINNYEGVFVALLLTNILSPFIDKLLERQNVLK